MSLAQVRLGLDRWRPSDLRLKGHTSRDLIRAHCIFAGRSLLRDSMHLWRRRVDLRHSAVGLYGLRLRGVVSPQVDVGRLIDNELTMSRRYVVGAHIPLWLMTE